MQKRLEIGSHVFIIESNRVITEVVVTADRGDFCVLRFPSSGAIQLRKSRVFASKEDAEMQILKKEPVQSGFHRPPYSKADPDEEKDEVDCSEPLMSEVRDPRIFCRQELEKDKQYDYEACCDRIRAAVKPAQADMLIAIILDGMTVAEYAALIGDTPNNVSHRYRRAINKLKKVF